MFKRRNKIKPELSQKNEANTYGAPVIAPDYSATVLATKMCINSNEHSMYIRSLWIQHVAKSKSRSRGTVSVGTCLYFTKTCSNETFIGVIEASA
jgi:hypothetical protein